MGDKVRVLFLCTQNSARSQMAEAFLRQGGGHRSKSLITEYFDQQVHLGYLITVCGNAEAQCLIYPWGGVREYWGFDDPTAFEGTPAARLAKFREVRDLIAERVKLFVTQEVAER